MSTRRILALLAATAVMALGAAAHAQDKVVVYSANDANLDRFVFDGFSKATGIAVEEVTAGSGVLFRRIASEKEKPLGDIIWGVSRALLQTNKGLLVPYAAKDKESTPAGFRDPDDLWIGTNVHLLVILQNTKDLPVAEGPKGWADLLDPKWKGKIAFTDPANSGSAYTNVTMLVQGWGADGWPKMTKLLTNTKVLNRSTLVFQGVGNGEFPLGMSLEYAGLQWAAGGAPVKVIYPQDGTVAQMEGVGIIRGGPHGEAARKFVDYITSKTVREEIVRKFFRRPARQDLDLSRLPGGMPALKEVTLLNYDEAGWTRKRTETLQKIQDIVRSTR